MTLYEKIKNMNIVDMSRMFCDAFDDCKSCIAEDKCRIGKNGMLEMLQEEIEEDEGDN